jgi:hypothetical protein
MNVMDLQAYKQPKGLVLLCSIACAIFWSPVSQGFATSDCVLVKVVLGREEVLTLTVR